MTARPSNLSPTLVALLAASSVACAGGFDGPSVQLGVGLANSKYEAVFPGWFQTTPSKTGFHGLVAVGYSKAMGSFNLAGSAFYVLGDQKAGTTNQQWDSSEKDSVSLQLGKTYGVTLEPGFNLSESTLLYVKLGFARSTATWTFARTATTWADSYSGTAAFNDLTFGAGAKHRLAPALYAFAEIQKTSFKRKGVDMTVRNHTTNTDATYTDYFKPASLTCFAGVGYSF